jgi:hypothetical protein
MGCASALTPWNWMSGVILACITALALFSNWQRRASGDPGITTEIALITTTLLGALSVGAPALAGAGAVLITIILAARDPLHRFVGQMVTADEVADVLLISGATLIVLPMLPDRPMGPFAALNPHAIWLVVIMILGINAVGQLATRLLGARLGVPMLGLVSGFISSSATIGAMGAWVRVNPASSRQGRGSSAFNGCQLCADGRGYRGYRSQRLCGDSRARCRSSPGRGSLGRLVHGGGMARDFGRTSQVQSVIQCDDRADVCRDAGWHADPGCCDACMVRCRGDRGSGRDWRRAGCPRRRDLDRDAGERENDHFDAGHRAGADRLYHQQHCQDAVFGHGRNESVCSTGHSRTGRHYCGVMDCRACGLADPLKSPWENLIYWI